MVTRSSGGLLGYVKYDLGNVRLRESRWNQVSDRRFVTSVWSQELSKTWTQLVRPLCGGIKRKNMRLHNWLRIKMSGLLAYTAF
jgi:hypothetical protein